MCALITGQQKSDLNAALRELERRVGLHGALKSAFNSLYGFTSDSNGIRHALLDETNLTFDDAKFMLVTCSAFVNYLKVRNGEGSHRQIRSSRTTVRTQRFTLTASEKRTARSLNPGSSWVGNSHCC